MNSTTPARAAVLGARNLGGAITPLDDALQTAADRLGPLDLIVNAVAPTRPPNDGTGSGGSAITEPTHTRFDQSVVAAARRGRWVP